MYSGDSTRVVHPLFHEEDDGSTPISPLQLIVGEISLTRAISLNEIWHSRLPVAKKSNMQRVRHLCCFGAHFANVFYAVGIWTDPIARRLNGLDILELRRFAIASDAPPNTATRIMRIMRMMIVNKFPHIKKLISYQDCEVHLGTIYAAAGWNPVSVTIPKNGWNTRKRDKSQANSKNKVRWEYDL